MPASRRANSKLASLSLWVPTPFVRNIFSGMFTFIQDTTEIDFSIFFKIAISHDAVRTVAVELERHGQTLKGRR
jgi:hypothetical protein